ncbi:restriction endonuclease subunit S [Enterococcus sp.]|uniref:restriction endonuclease subunit S n=1 Tax=Enterococcus sp. TaxID=35783 RepID=UPI0028AC3C9D|nr:restriction endonuclease subunit S [Enterococcus sp.]
MSNDTQPEIRFPGFTEDWEERKLGDVGNTFTGLTGKTKEDFGHGSAKFVTYVNVFQNPIATLDQLDAIEIDEKQNQVQKGDIFFTTSSETPEEVGMSSVWTHDTENVYLNSFTFGYRPRVSFDLNYMASMLRSPSIRKKITFLAQGISRYNISKTKMLEIKIPTPTLSEQEKIGSFFKQLDDTIALHQRKLDLLKETKKGFLQKMFPKNGAKVPEIRFPGFTEDWEQRKLGGIGKTYTGLTGKSKEDFGHGDAKFVTYMNVFQNPKATLEQLENVEIDPRQNEVKKGDVFFTTSSETPEEVGMSSVWTHDINNIYLNSFTFAYRPTIKFDLDYLAFMLRSQSVRKKIIFLAQGISRYNISKTKMMDISVPIPVNFEEQQKIGAFFKQLDDTIALHQRKLDLLKETKKGFLQKMFV